MSSLRNGFEALTSKVTVSSRPQPLLDKGNPAFNKEAELEEVGSRSYEKVARWLVEGVAMWRGSRSEEGPDRGVLLL